MSIDDARPYEIAAANASREAADLRSYTGSRTRAAARTAPYRILIIAPTPFFVDRGGHVQIYEQARALQQLGNTVELCTYHLGRDMPGLPVYRIPKVNWYTKTDAGPAYGKLYLMFLLFFLSLRQIIRFKPDVIHAHGWDGCWIASVLRLFTGIPFIFNMQGSFTGEIVEHGYARHGSLFYKLLRQIESWTLGLGRVVAPTDSMVNNAINNFGVRRDHIYHTYDGVDIEDLQPDTDPGALKAELGISADRRIVVFLGLLKTYQGVDVLLDAIHILTDELAVTNAHFLIMGFPDADKYAAKAAALNIGRYTTFPGKIDYKRRKYYYALGDVAVAPKLSPAEGDGKIYDYLAMGLPIVTFDCPVSRDILGDVAFYAELGDPRSLAEALRTSLIETGRAAEYAQQGRAMAVDRYSWLAVGKRLMVAYADALAPTKRSPKVARP